MRFVHVADVHLDTSFTGRSTSVRQRLRDASREAFERSVDLAISEDVHAFVNWDPQRGQHGLEVLSDLSNSRQVFVFTCHPSVAEFLEQRGGQVLKVGSGM